MNAHQNEAGYLEDAKIINVVQGEYHVTDRNDVVLSTVLGSCISVCMYDPVLGIGGMNHFLLPGTSGGMSARQRYGAYSMEVLINALLKRGASKETISAKMFGGANVLGNNSKIGASNAEFARQFLRDENIACLSESVGGAQARRIRFWPTTGMVKQLLVQDIPNEIPPPVVEDKPDIVLF